MTNSASFRTAVAHPETLRVSCSQAAEMILILTLRLAGSAYGVHLVAWVTFTLKISFEVDADLTAGIWVLTLVDVCEEKHTGNHTLLSECFINKSLYFLIPQNKNLRMSFYPGVCIRQDTDTRIRWVDPHRYENSRRCSSCIRLNL